MIKKISLCIYSFFAKSSAVRFETHPEEIQLATFSKSIGRICIPTIFLVWSLAAFSSEGMESQENLVFSFSQSQKKEQNDSLQKPFAILREHLKLNQYLKPLITLQKKEEAYLNSPLKESFLEAVILLNSYLGDYEEAYRYEEILLAHFDSFNKLREQNKKEIKSSRVDSLAMVSALDFVSSKAQGHQVIMINEEHRHSLHRGFLSKLLPVLYEKGFRYFAAETFASKDSLLNERGYPIQSSGFYTSDPVFSRLVRAAKMEGYKTVAYEFEGEFPSKASPEEKQEMREKGQAMNIIQRILEEDPTAKIVVFAGRAHIAEARTPSFGFMAWHFKELTGIDPFTIDQTQLSERFAEFDEPPIYRYLVEDRQPDEPVVFVNQNMNGWSGSQFYDLTVLHPRSFDISGRINWLNNDSLKNISLLAGNLNLQDVVSGSVFNVSGPLEVQAFKEGDAEDAVPLDIVLIKPGEKMRPLLLCPGNFLLKVRDSTGKVVAERKVEITS